MKILSVEITNITSIEGPYLINFESDLFSNIGLFGITGPVGAGKSSIIDSICLGLYNTTPRLERSTSSTSIQYEAEAVTTNSPQNLLRRGASSGSVVVRFKAIDGHVWQSTWLLRRARDLANGKLQGVSMILQNESLNETFPDNKLTKVLEKIKLLIGLDFKQFTKSVILAQGDFQAFLNATDGDRAQILEKLTGTEIYSEISKAIYEKNNQIKDEFLQIENQINALNLLSEDEITSLVNRINEIDAEIKKLNTINEQLTTFKNWYITKDELEQQIANLEKQLIETQEQVNQLKADTDVLNNIEKVQDIKPTLIENDENIKKITLFEVEVNTLINQKKDLNKRSETLQHSLLEETQNKALILQQIETNEPLYKEARALDVQLTHSEKQINEQKQVIKTRSTEIDQIWLQISNKKQGIETIGNQILGINSWFTSNESVKNWVDNTSLLQHQFQKFSEVSVKIKSLINQHQTIKSQADSNNHNLQNYQQKQNLLSTQVTIYNTDIDRLKTDIKDQNFEATISKQNETNSQLSTLKDLKNIAETYQKQKQQVQNTLSELTLNEKNLKSEKLALKNTQIDLEKLSTEINHQRFYVDKLKLESSSNVLHLRSQLQPGCECPVCGSTEHKLEKVSGIEGLAIQAEIDLKVLEQNEKYLLTTLSKHEATCKHLTESIDNLKVRNNELELDIKVSSQKWDQVCTTNFMLELNQDNVLDDILKLESTKIKEITQLSDLIIHITTIQKNIEIKESEKNKLQSELELIITQINQLKIEEQKFKTNLDQIKNDGIKLREEQKIDQTKIEQIINIPNWLKLFEDDANQFTQSVFKQIEIWQANAKKIESLKTELNQVETDSAKLNSVFEEKDNELKALQKNTEQLILIHTEQQISRKSYFNGDSIDWVEQNLKLKRNTNEQLVLKLTSDLNELKSEIIKLETSYTDKKQQIKSLKDKVASNIEIINQFISTFNYSNNFNLDIEQLQQLCNYSNEWILNTREKFDQIKQTISSLDGAKKAISKQLEKHLQTNAPEKSIEQIVEYKLEIEEKIKENQDLLITEKGKQINHINNISSQKSLLIQRENLLPNYKDWAELSNLLGSASGDRLKKLAQQFTLDLLLQAANAQLQQINNRYILERIDETLSILVIDQYMANSKRATNSLSGGETFLVSLALSLALSTIASTQLKVESLFIDEGFGSLDPNSLETAFLALENLQSQGRMVGVISHLDAVIDRLTVKIEVTPQGNGKSKIQIVA